MAAECVVETPPSTQPPTTSAPGFGQNLPCLRKGPDQLMPSQCPAGNDLSDLSTLHGQGIIGKPEPALGMTYPDLTVADEARTSTSCEPAVRVKVKVTAATPPSPVDVLESPCSDCPDGLSAQLAPILTSAGSDSHTDGGTGAETASSNNSTRRRRKRTRPKKEKSVMLVTEEARRVLDQYLKRSLSQNDASPLQHALQGVDHMEVIDEDFVDGRPSQATGGTSFKRSSESFDDATSHSPESVTTRSLYSNSSHSSSFRHRIHIIRPLPDEKQLEAALKKNKLKKNNRARWQSRKDSTSSSSSSDSDTNNSESGPRRKKSLFKRATARLRQSLRKFKDKSPNDQENVEGHLSREGTKKKSFFKLGQAGSDKSPSSADISPAVPKDVVGEINNHGQTMVQVDSSHATNRNGSVVLWNKENEPITDQKRLRSPFQHEVGHRNKEIVAQPDKEKKKDTKGLFDSLIKQIRKGGEKLRRKGSKGHSLGARSRSADAITFHSIHPVDGPDASRRLVNNVPVRKGSLGERGIHGVNTVSGASNSLVGVAATCPDGVERFNIESIHQPSRSRQGHHSVRQRLKLEDLVPYQVPAQTAAGEEGDSVTREVQSPPGGAALLEDVVPQHPRLPHLVDQDGLDELDYGSPTLVRAHQDGEDKPFHQKTEHEKEELYEKIAEQLAMIADTYDMESRRSSFRLTPLSPPSLTSPSPSTEPEKEESIKKAEQGATARPERPTRLEPPSDVGLEQRLGQILREHGDAAAEDMPDFSPVVRDLVRNASYSKFQQIVNEKIGKEPGWEQLALMFRLTQSAIQLAGMGTAVALQIKENTLQYFEDRFAGWVIGQGGWESVVEESDLDDEVD